MELAALAVWVAFLWLIARTPRAHLQLGWLVAVGLLVAGIALALFFPALR